MKIHDTGYKDLFSNKDVFINFIRNYVDSPWSKIIKEEDILVIDKSFILEDYEKIESDLIYKAKIKDEEVIFYILLEFQSSVDYSMPIRLLFYITSCLREEVKNTPKNKLKQKKFKLPAVVPLVLYNGKQKWTTPTEFKEKVNKSELFGENIINFKYILFDINRYSEKELVDRGDVSSAVFLMDQNDSIKNLIDRVSKIAKEFEKLSDRDKNILIRWIESNKFEKEITKGLEKILKSDKKEVDKMTSNVYKTVYEFEKMSINKGILQGKKEGVLEGIIQGKKEGILEGIVQGKKEGKLEEKLNIAKALLDVLDDKTISEKTNLDIEVVSKLRLENR